MTGSYNLDHLYYQIDVKTVRFSYNRNGFENASCSHHQL